MEWVNLANSDYTLEALTDTDTFAVFYFETTGFKVEWHEIIEIGAVKIVKREVIDTFSTLVKPYRKISEEITEITGITNEMVADAPEIRSAMYQYYKMSF